MDSEDKQLSPYGEKMNYFIQHIPSTRFIIEVSKFCGYSEFVLIYKKNTLLDVYKTISLQFECNDIKGLYLTNSREHKIPITENINIRDFIAKHSNIMKPVYDMPFPVVYKIFLDDGHCCIDTVKLGDHI
jgi:predicted nucleic-acid-binding Zn-ribbon protein